MDFKYRELKREARGILRAAWPGMWLIAIAYLLLTSGVAMGVELIAGDLWQQITEFLLRGLSVERALALALRRVGSVGIFVNLLLLFYGIIMDFGCRQWLLNASRGRGAVSDLLSGLAMTRQVILLRLLTMLYGLIWYVLILIPALLAAMLAASRLVSIALLSAAAAVYAMCLLRYSLAPYCLMDDERHSVLNALRRSVRLMRGNTRKLGFLLLSFLGWLALAALLFSGMEDVLGLVLQGGASVVFDVIAAVCTWPLLAWVMPYLLLSVCIFYDRVAERQEQQAIPQY